MFLAHEYDMRSLKWSTVAPKSTEGENKILINKNPRFLH